MTDTKREDGSIDLAANETRGRQGLSSFWHGFANMAHVTPEREVVIVRGEGCEVQDRDGQRYLDATASLWYCIVGYGRQSIVAAVERQMRTLPAYSTFGPYTNEAALNLSDRVSQLAPLSDGKVFLTSSGSEAVDTAAKLARRYWNAVGRPDKKVIIGRHHAYHGMNAYGTSLAGIETNAEGYGEIVPSVAHVPHNSVDALAEEFERLDSDQVAAFIGEPVIGAGGVIPPSENYWSQIAALCHQHDVLLIADEVVTAWGRLGKWFGCERFGFEPDILTFAKGITSGYMPLGGVVVGPRVQEPFWSGEGIDFRHGYTYSGHAAACAAALSNLDIIEDEDLLGRVAALEPMWMSKVGALSEHPSVQEVRAIGLLAAVDLADDDDPGLAERVVENARREGLLTRTLRGGALHLSPSLVIAPEQIDELVNALRRALDTTRSS